LAGLKPHRIISPLINPAKAERFCFELKFVFYVISKRNLIVAEQHFLLCKKVTLIRRFFRHKH